MFETVGFAAQSEAARVVEDPIEHGRRKRLVAHEFFPLRYLLVRGVNTIEVRSCLGHPTRS